MKRQSKAEEALNKQIRTIEPEGLHLDCCIYGLSLSRDASLAAITSTSLDKEQGKLYDLRSGERLIGVADATYGEPKFSPNGTKVLFDVYHGLALFDVPSRRAIELPEHFNCSEAAFSPDGRFLAIHSFEHYVAILAIDDGPRR